MALYVRKAQHTQQRSMLQMQLDDLVQQIVVLEYKLVTLQRRYQELPLEVSQHPTLISDPSRVMCAIELGKNHPFARLPETRKLLDNNVNWIQHAINNGPMDIATNNLGYTKRVFQEVEHRVWCLAGALEAHEEAKRILNLDRKIRSFIQVVEHFDIVREGLQTRYDSLVPAIREMPLASEAAQEFCGCEVGPSRFSMSRYRGLKHSIDLVADAVLSARAGGRLDAVDTYLQAAHQHLAAMQAYLQDLTAAVDEHVKVEERFIHWLDSVSIGHELHPPLVSEDDEGIVLEPRFRVAIHAMSINAYETEKEPVLQHPKPISWKARRSVDRWTPHVPDALGVDKKIDFGLSNPIRGVVDFDMSQNIQVGRERN